jgi:hypothetical protein
MLLDGVGRVRAHLDALHLRLQRRDKVVEQLVEDRALRFEVEIEGAAAILAAAIMSSMLVSW